MTEREELLKQKEREFLEALAKLHKLQRLAQNLLEPALAHAAQARLELAKLKYKVDFTK